MLIDAVTNAGALPALEAMVRFAGGRQRLIAHNVANISTPEFQPMDVSVRGFQDMLGRAIRERRDRTGGSHGRLELRDTPEVEVVVSGLRLKPRTSQGGVLFHDRNNRDLERMMQAVAENTAAFRVASDLMRHQTMMMRSAMGERVA